MSRVRPTPERTLSSTLVLSFVLHLLAAGLLLRLQHRTLPVAPVYYVDVLSLPVANPQAGNPGPPAATLSPAQAAPLPSAPTPAAPASMPASSKGTPPRTAGSSEESREYQERLARLERQAEERRQAAAIEALRGRTAGKSGVPGGTGTQAGSDYGNYVQSRLRDALSSTIAYQSKNPQVVLRITIDRQGRVARTVMERSTRDRLFEEAVLRAVAIAEKNLPPPPSGREFEQGFIFRPQGVGTQ